MPCSYIFEVNVINLVVNDESKLTMSTHGIVKIAHSNKVLTNVDAIKIKNCILKNNSI